MTFREDNITFALSGKDLTAAHNGIDLPKLVDGGNPDGMSLHLYILAQQFLQKNPGSSILPHVVATFEKQFGFLPDLLAQRLRIIFLLRQDPPCLSSNADVLGLLALWIYRGQAPSTRNNAVALASGGIMGSLSYPFLLAADRVVTSNTVLAPGIMIDTGQVTVDIISEARKDLLNVLCRSAGYGELKAGLQRRAPVYVAASLPPAQLLYESPLAPMIYSHNLGNTLPLGQDHFPAAIVSDRGELQKKYEVLVGDKIAPSVHKWFQAA